MLKYSQEEASQTATANTESKDNTQNRIPVHGKLHSVKLDLTGAASPQVDISLISLADEGIGSARTLYNITATGDRYDIIRENAVNSTGSAITNSFTQNALAGDVLYLECTNATKAGINVELRVFIEHP